MAVTVSLATGACSDRDDSGVTTEATRGRSQATVAPPTRRVATNTAVPSPRLEATAPAAPPTALPPRFDRLTFLDSLPLPVDAEILPVVQGIDIGYRTRETEPAIIALYTGWIVSQGWVKASELPYLRPNERWTKGGFEFVVYITPKGAGGVAVINIQVRPQTAP